MTQPQIPVEPGLLPIASAAQVRARVLDLARPHRGRFALAALALTIGTAIVLVGPRLIGEIVDRVLAGDSAAAITAPALALVAVAVLAGAFEAAGRTLVATAGEPVLAALREDVVDSALAASPDTIERAGSGDLVSRVSGDVEAVSDLVGQALPALLRSGLTIGLTVIGLAALDWRLALAALAAVPVQALALRWYLGVTGPMYAAERVAEGARAQALLAATEGAATIRAYRLGAEHTARIGVRCRAALEISLHTTRQQTRFYGQLNLAELIGTAAVLVIGFVLVRAGEITIGATTAAGLYFIRLFDPINTLLGLIDDLQEATAGLARLVGVTQLPPALPPGHPATPADSTVVLAGVGHSYLPGHPVLREVDLTLRQGERVALVGASGAGKTTLARLLSGASAPTSGRIEIGGVSVADLDPTAARPAVVLVSQEVHAFAGTLAEDLRLARPDAGEADLLAALDTVGAGTWLGALPDGLDTVVGAGGHRLTNTQAQQLALARLVLADPLVAILDEATAEAGSAGARVLEAAAARALAGRTALIVAHRLTQAAAADRVVVLDAGRVVEQGPHTQLVTAGGPYARLWEAWSQDRGPSS